MEKILVAIGDKNLRDLLLPKIKEEGYLVDEAQDSLDVLTRVKNFKPDLALIDINLPNVPGSELFTPEYVHKDIAKTPIIIISNSIDPIPMKLIPATPTIKDYIIKFHIEPSEVLEKIGKVFGRVKAEKVEKKSGEGKKILWVEDDKLLSNILSKKIENSGYELTRVDNGKDALNYLENKIPDIIILDILLPEMNGFDILQALKSKKNLKGVPVIILSNLSRQADIDKAKNLGADKFLVKAAVSLDEILKETELEMSKA
jgi:DNA-binding response OmpR family regulator